MPLFSQLRCRFVCFTHNSTEKGKYVQKTPSFFTVFLGCMVLLPCWFGMVVWYAYFEALRGSLYAQAVIFQSFQKHHCSSSNIFDIEKKTWSNCLKIILQVSIFLDQFFTRGFLAQQLSPKGQFLQHILIFTIAIKSASSSLLRMPCHRSIAIFCSMFQGGWFGIPRMGYKPFMYDD